MIIWTPAVLSALVALAQSCANHVQHIERLSHAMCRVPHGTNGISAVKFDTVEIAFILALFYWLNINR